MSAHPSLLPTSALTTVYVLAYTGLVVAPIIASSSPGMQVSGVARTQPMPGHSMGTLRLRVAPYPGPAQL